METELEAAETAVDESTDEISRLHAEMREYQGRTGLILDRGVPVSFATDTAEGAKAVHDFVRDFKQRFTAAEKRFQERLSRWAGLKKGQA